MDIPKGHQDFCLPQLISTFKPYKQGAEARLFKGQFLGVHCVAKQRFSKKYRHPVLDQTLTRERLKAEVRALNKCKTLNIKTPTIYLADKDLIIMEDLEKFETVREFIDKSEEMTNLGAQIGQILGKLHANNVIHGDLTTSNILISKDGSLELALIDFGLGFSEGSAEDKAVDLYVLERALLSTHPGSEEIFGQILKAYEKEMKKTVSNAKEIVNKFNEVRMRGRKRTMVG